MDDDPSPALLAAVEAGRGQRGRLAPEDWVVHRARVLALVARGLTYARVGGALGLSATRVRELVAEACEAILRGGGSGVEAVVCRETWRRWCQQGDTDACQHQPQARASRGGGLA